MRRKCPTRHALAGVLACAAAPAALAGSVAEVVGIPELVARVGQNNLPTGLGVVVSQVEAPENGGYSPDQADAEFAAKIFTLKSGATTASGHATLVGKNLYGLTTSVAPGINNIFVYEASNWA